MRISALPSRIPDRWLDPLVAAAVTAITLASISAAHEDGAREPDLAGYLLGVLCAGVLLFRRRWPVQVLLATVVAGFVYHSSGYPGGPPLIAAWVALYTVAASGMTGVALLVALWNSGGGFLYRALAEGDNPIELSMLVEPAMTVTAIMLGDAMHARRKWADEVGERLRHAEVESDLEARRRVDAERLRIAQELHDVLAHTLAVVSVQAGVASELLDDDREAARKALDEMRRASREAMGELRATVGILRDSTPAPLAPAPGMHALDRIVEGARQAGVHVETTIEGEAAGVPTAVDLAAFRVVQEALTNVVKHAAARSARVFVGYQPEGITIEVADDGRGANGHASDGFGIRGMRERVEALGGRLEAGSRAPAGFEVRAWLPVQRT